MFKISKGIMRAMLFIIVFFAVFQSGAFYAIYKAPSDNIYTFFVKDKVYMIEENTIKDLSPRVQFYNTIIKDIWIGLMLLLIILVLDYFEDPKEHFVTQLILKFKKMEVE